MASASEQVARDLKAKISLEAKFRPKVNRLFKRMINAHAESVARTGMPLNAQAFNQEWIDLLLQHYKLCQDAFVGSVASFNEKSLAGLETKQEPEVDASDMLAGALLAWSERQAPRQAQFITATNANNVAESMRQAREALIEDEQEVDDRSMAATSTAVLTRQMSGRVDSIVMTETQSASETAKVMEAYDMSDINPNVLLSGSIVASTTTKNWRTIGDKKVRSAHANANRQSRQLHEPFDVGGEQLRYPGDSGLGATPKNTANCRCSSIYRI